MKNLLLLFCLLCTTGLLQAQVVNSFPYAEDFETFGSCVDNCGSPCTLSNGWVNLTSDGMDWTAYSGATTSSNTGPTANGGADHNPGVAGGTYLFTETSSGCTNISAVMESPMFQTDNSMSNLFLDFWFHMFGSSMGYLLVDLQVYNNGLPGAITRLDSIGPYNVDMWQQSLLNLTPYVGDTFKIIFTGMTGSSFTSDMAIDDVKLYSIFPNDARVVSIDSPVNPISAGLNDIDVTIQNTGLDTLFNVTIGWTVNGTPQTPFLWSDTVTSGNLYGPFNIGSYNFPAGLHTVRAWTELPNGVPDSSTALDTAEVVLCTPLSGVYTVGGSGADFATLTDAANAINSCGVNGPVTMMINPGTYTETIAFINVPGASATNTITFDGGSPGSVTIVGASNSSAIITLDSSDHFTFKRMTLHHQGTTDAYGLWLLNRADSITIDSVSFVMDTTTTSSDVVGIVASGSATSPFTDNNSFKDLMVVDCWFTGGDAGIILNGDFSAFNAGFELWNSSFRQHESYAIYLDNIDSLRIIGNSIRDQRSTLADGIYALDIVNFEIEENFIYVDDYGLYISDGNFDFLPTWRSTIINNMISSTADYGIYLDDANDIDINHNTSYAEPAIRMNDFFNMDIRNNIFMSDGDYAFETVDAFGVNDTVDYNLYWTPSTNTLYVYYAATLYNDLPSWQVAVTGYNANSVEGDPITVNGKSDLHLVGLAANDAGLNSVGITIDIDGDVRPAPTATAVDMGADEYTPAADDAFVVSLLEPGSNICGDSLQPVTVVLSSFGVDTIFTMPVTVNITGAGTGTINYTYNDTLTFMENDTVTVGTFNTYLGGLYTFTVYTGLTGDQDTSNDTLVTEVFIQGYQNPMTMGDTVTCIGDSTFLVGMNGPGWQYAWYDSLTGGNLLAVGDTFFVPPMMVADTTFYLGFSATGSLTSTFDGGNGCSGGNMFDLQASGATDLAITGFDMNLDGTGPQVVNVYYIPNGTYVGNETNGAAWTSAGTYNVNAQGAGNPTHLDLTNSVVIPQGQTYAWYVEFNADYTNGTTTFSNSDITMYTGAGLCSSFGGINTGRMFNGTVYYTIPPCNLTRTPVTVSVDTTAPVAGYTSAVTAPTVNFTSTASGKQITYYWTFGDGDTAIVANPSHTYATEGTYNVCLTVTDICGDTAAYCDSVDVCAPVSAAFNYSVGGAGFSFNFTDMSGGTPVAWDWDFGDTNTDNTQNPSHTYASAGSYTVTLIVTNACGEMDTTTMAVIVTGMEDVLSTEPSIYPNPGSGRFNISLPASVSGAFNFTISDMTGRTVYKGVVKGGETVVADLTGVTQGVYILNIQDKDTIHRYKLIKD